MRQIPQAHEGGGIPAERADVMLGGGRGVGRTTAPRAKADRDSPTALLSKLQGAKTPDASRAAMPRVLPVPSATVLGLQIGFNPRERE